MSVDSTQFDLPSAAALAAPCCGLEPRKRALLGLSAAAYLSSSNSSHSRQTHSASGLVSALSAEGTIVTPQRGQIGGRSSSFTL